ncbi:hypothetical protein B0T10DRAFT_466147 [Thelonectria olida]|uniref:Uncharacterized protein n=1 Tax=Thelonectria olida TaxID=1576542 RepID=A0A9P8VSC0_9HYPO|nr:hypothetical protein B0T10DRAFT_466147 [Thelonectria olida]
MERKYCPNIIAPPPDQMRYGSAFDPSWCSVALVAVTVVLKANRHQSQPAEDTEKWWATPLKLSNQRCLRAVTITIRNLHLVTVAKPHARDWSAILPCGEIDMRAFSSTTLATAGVERHYPSALDEAAEDQTAIANEGACLKVIGMHSWKQSLMDTEEPPSQAVNAYDDDSFILIDDSRREQPADNTCRPTKDPVRDRGYNFKPVSLPARPLEITQLPQEPLLLFRQFTPTSLVETWVQYTNSWVSHLLEEAQGGSRCLGPRHGYLNGSRPVLQKSMCGLQS